MMTIPSSPPSFLPEPGYATNVDYLASEGSLPDTAAAVDAKLRKASRFIDSVLIGALYETDTNNLPTDTGALAALKAAVIAQVAFWYSGYGSEFGEPAYDEMKIGTVLLKGAKSGNMLAPQAMYELRTVGLLPVSARTFG